MALLNCRFFSEALRESTTMTVIMPESAAGQIGMETVAGDGKPQVLYLLHGLSDDDSIWQRRTSIERYVAPLGLAVVMPKVGRSFYANEHCGQNYWTFISEELPTMIPHMFNVSSAREDTFVAGLSMGGFGAFKLALHAPEKFGAAASLSGALDMIDSPAALNLRTEVPQLWPEEGPKGTIDDLVYQLGQKDPATIPPLYQVCGTEDFLYTENVTFEQAAKARGYNLTSDLTQPGDHEWGYWDTEIQKVLEWLPLRRK